MNQDELNQALFKAVEDNRIDEIKRLLSEGADVNATNKNRDTPLHLAAFYGPVKIVETLITAGADVNARNKQRNTPLHNSSLYGPPPLRPLRRDDGMSMEGHIKDLINSRIKLNSITKEIWTSSNKAVLDDLSGITEILIKSGANIDAKDRNGQTPLMVALSMESETKAIQLIEAGADVNTKTKREKVTSLHFAVYYLNSFMACHLLEAGADIFAKDMNGDTPLDHARHLEREVGRDVFDFLDLEAHLTSLEQKELQSVIIPGEDKPSKQKKL